MRAWSGLCLALAVASALAWFAPPTAWFWDASTWVHRPWTLWTAGLVHLSGSHLVANLLALAALAVLGEALHAGRGAALALLLAWPTGTALLAMWPQVTRYGGLSGTIHAAVMVLWAHCAVRRVAVPVSFVLFVAMGLKLATEQAWVRPVVFDPDWGFNVAVAAHLTGALAGAGWGLLLGLLGFAAPAKWSNSHG